MLPDRISECGDQRLVIDPVVRRTGPAPSPRPAATHSSPRFQFTAAMKSLSFCDAFFSSSVLACSVLYEVKNIQPCEGPFPAWARS